MEGGEKKNGWGQNVEWSSQFFSINCYANAS
jgi:hypothetical protein